jgi:hypothetical protein
MLEKKLHAKIRLNLKSKLIKLHLDFKLIYQKQLNKLCKKK